MAKKQSAEKAVRDIRRKTRRRFTAEEKIRIVIEGLRGVTPPTTPTPSHRWSARAWSPSRSPRLRKA